ncbi:MAG: helix-turn-helix transcriptional regulator [Lachnospiraceae bacterium]
MSNVIIQHYIKLTEFLGSVLGPDYEIVLHDVSEPEYSIVAIANGHISGRTIGDPLTDFVCSLIQNKEYENNNSCINYTGIAADNNKMLRSSAFYIKDQNSMLVGVLCINFDDSRYQELSERLLGLRHPDAFVSTNFVYNKEKTLPERSHTEGMENLHGSVALVVQSAIEQVVGGSNVPAERLTKEEKLKIISILDEKGVFLLKNAVKQVAELLCCSTATVYRYLNTR